VQESIVIHGARVNNLKNVHLSIPHNQLTVVTGVSGSGKSSLVFDTIYAEGQRRYVESLSAYARQFLERMEKPDVDHIDGIAPPVAIRQKNTTRNPRSTVATSTELHDFLRLLFARAGRTYCPGCGEAVARDTVDHVAARLTALPEGSRWYALFPVGQSLKTEALRDRLFELRKKGFNRLYQNGRTFEFSTPESLLEIDFSQPLHALVDRLAMPAPRQRLVDTVEICYREAGEAILEPAAGGERLRFSEKFSCKRCNRDFADPEPRLFSFNNPYGACARCQGFGNTVDYAPDLIVPDPWKTLDQNAIAPWSTPQYRLYYSEFKRRHRGQVRFQTPYVELRDDEKETIHREIRGFFRYLDTKKYKVHVRVFISRFRGYSECPDCGGSRLRPEALWVRVGGKTIAEVSRLNIAQALAFFDAVELGPEEGAVAGKVLVEIRQRLRFLNDVGLDYLTLDRLSATLSGGEAQRIQLATCLGSRLVGACYVLDEPSIGLHSRDTGRLIRILHELRDLGNTIVVVEHDGEVMRAADHIVDLGPGAGESGGRVTFEGPYAALCSDGAGSLTGRYLSGAMATAKRHVRRAVNQRRTVRFLGCRAHNLKDIDVTLPLDMMVVITGVSGSGKSTLVHEVIDRSLKRALGQEEHAEGDEASETGEKLTCRKVEGARLVRQVVLVDQSPIGRTPRSNPVTYIKAFDQIRELFAATPESDRRGYTAGHFSFNIPGGRCETCQGDGTVTVEMQFLADVELVCEECKGTRFKSSILDVRYRGLNVHEVLRLSVAEALHFFSDVPRLAARLRLLSEVGLGYLRLGQSATTLSGGEAQRVKLAAHLALSDCKHALFIFDEPTTGLHFDDIAKLLAAFQRLIDSGASVLIIEHNLDVIRNADWIIDLGPEGGDRGGRVVAQGTVDQVARAAGSHTGRYLRELRRGFGSEGIQTPAGAEAGSATPHVPIEGK
jgi:excinuclease ABC subunit A